MKLFAIASALALAFASGAQAQDPGRGRLLYETYCGECHYPRVHQRSAETTKVKSLADLREAVARWAPATDR